MCGYFRRYVFQGGAILSGGHSRENFLKAYQRWVHPRNLKSVRTRLLFPPGGARLDIIKEINGQLAPHGARLIEDHDGR